MARVRDDRRRLSRDADQRGEARHAGDDAVDRTGLGDEDAHIGRGEPRHEADRVQRGRHDEVGAERGHALEIDVLESADPRNRTELRGKLRVFFDPDEVPMRTDGDERVRAAWRE